MRYSPLAGLAVAAALFLPAPAGAQAPRVKITGVRVGFPGSLHRASGGMGLQTRFKPGHWAPVYVDLEVKDAPLKAGTYVLQVETTDSDDMQNVYVEKRFLPTIETTEAPTLLTYVRFGNGGSEMTVKVLDAANPDREYRREHLTSADISGSGQSRPYSYAYLSIGGKVRGLYKALTPKQNAPQPGAEGAEEPDPEENGTRTFANIETAGQMPTYWFGYQPVDTVILLTSEEKFIGELLSAQKDDPIAARRDALAEWVRRGGHLILSVSKNHQEVKQILEQMNIIDLTIDGRTEAHEVPGAPGGQAVQRLQGVERWANAPAFYGVTPKNQPGARPGKIEIAKLKPGPGVQVLAYDTADGREKDAHPVLVQAPCGLGRVIVCAFDLDDAPFTAWKGQTAFWERMKAFNEPASVGNDLQNPGVNVWNRGDNTELAGKLVHSLEDFPDVPVISFGWVSLFILIYILIVGPLDYFFLKKVVKRLELTWITFPAVVIVISAIAYFAAYYLKGKDLRVNKVDVVDVDLHGSAVYGSTWFTLFSPRIQNYTIGVEPGTGWGAEEKDPKKFAPFVSWMGRPEEAWVTHGGSGGLFRRAYNYAPESSGLVGVPIQVWSTKTFSASWARPIKEDELVEARLEAAKNDPSGMKLSGTITSKLPVELRDAVLFYRENFYTLGNLTPGNPLRIDQAMATPGKPETWVGQSLQSNLGKSGTRRGAYYGQDVVQPVGSYIKSILFHAYTGQNVQQSLKNGSLRYLDERWRLDKDNTKEAILFGQAAPPAGLTSEGNAEAMSQSGLSASKLWLGALPGEGKARSAIQGTLSQETYVRVYIPVK
jgi:hypothetical protein